MLLQTAELDDKLTRLRAAVGPDCVVRLRGIDWFAWLLCGASNAVLLAAETGVAEAVLTPDGLHVLTDVIEAERLRDEELPGPIQLHAFPWTLPEARETWVRQHGGAGEVLSDRPRPGEGQLPSAVQRLKWRLLPDERARYAEVGARAASAMTEAMTAAEPDWSEHMLAAAGARALLARGLQPALILAAGERRLPQYRHPLPTAECLGATAMLVFCARGHGLYANLTRFISFGPLSSARAAGHDSVREIEAAALAQCQPDTRLGRLYDVLAAAYRDTGHPHAIEAHHQGGITGYQAREVLVRPGGPETLQDGMALALNPSLAGAKIEDTFIVAEDGLLHNLTFDPAWPHLEVAGRPRPSVLER